MAHTIPIEQFEPLISEIIASRFTDLPSYAKDDAAQTARIKLWAKLPAYDPRRGEVGAYARSIIESAILDELRQADRQRRSIEHLRSTDCPTEDADPDDLAVAAAIERNPDHFLPRYLQKVLRAIQSHDSPGEAAAAIGMKPKSFYELSSRVKSELRKHFAVKVQQLQT